VLQSSTIPGAAPLDYSTMRSLLEPSPLHKATWNKYLRELGNRRP
jgi:hypothetical protein